MVKDTLKSGIEEENARIIPHVAAAMKDKLQRIVTSLRPSVFTDGF